MAKDNINSLYKLSEVELVYRNKVKACDRPRILTSSLAYNVLMANWDMNRIELVEEFKILLLNRSNYCIGISNISVGGLTATIADTRLILVTALKTAAVSIILAHNHPSGNPRPSENDIDATRKIREAGKFHDIGVIDHLVVTPHRFYSFADEGIMLLRI